MGSDDRDSAVYAPFDAIKRHYGYLHRIKDIREALQLAPKVIKRMAAENQLWGAERIRSGLLKLGIRAGKRTVQRYIGGAARHARAARHGQRQRPPRIPHTIFALFNYSQVNGRFSPAFCGLIVR